MSRRFWKEIRKVIPQKISIRRPRKSSKKIMRALFFILRTGIPWKALPLKFHVSPSTVHRRFQEWVEDQVFFNFWKKILEKYQKTNHEMMKWIAIDGSVAKSPLGGECVGPSPVDRRKIGTKKHICVDQNGIVLGITVSGANKHDNIFLQETLHNIPISLRHNRIVFAADTAYDAKNTRAFLKKKGFAAIIPHNKRRSKKIISITRSRHRWIIERTFSHLKNGAVYLFDGIKKLKTM
jgi:transposase